MVVVSSTEFQQNVGHYFDIAKQGKKVVVERKRPKGDFFEIVISQQQPQSTQVKTIKERREFIEKIASKNLIDNPYKNGVVLQRKIRS